MIDQPIEKVQVTPTSSFFHRNGLFGSWPSQDDIEALVAWGVDVIVNLACATEKKVKPYTVPPDTNIDVVNFPIQDRSTPDDKIAFCSLVIKICDCLAKGRKVYIHCKGGHGRSGLLVAAVIAYHLGKTPQEAIALTSMYHAERRVMRQRWRELGSPQTVYQKKFIANLFCGHDTQLVFGRDVERRFDAILLQTHLGQIVGPESEKLMRRREKLMKSSIIQ